MTKTSTPDWDPRDDSVLRDQRRAYDDMRLRCPVAYSDFLNWSLFRHDDIKEVLADPETYSSASNHLAIPNGMDPPQHTLYRQLLEPYFDAAAMAAFEPHCRRIAVDLLDSILARDAMDIVSEFIEPFALKSLCAYLGWSLDLWDKLRGWTHGNQQVALSRDRKTGSVLAAEYTGYVTQALDLRRREGAETSDDLTSRLMAVEVDGKRLSDEEIVSILRNWTAGHGTVAAGIGLVVLYVAEHEALQRQLRDDPMMLPATIDEILRVDGPLVANRRTTTREVEIGGQMIAGGEKLSLMWIAANRDEDAFDDADEVRPDRDPAENLLFGWGIHVCQGAPLARLEMRVAIEELLARTGQIQLVETETPQRSVYPSNGLEAMRMRLG